MKKIPSYAQLMALAPTDYNLAVDEMVREDQQAHFAQAISYYEARAKVATKRRKMVY